MVSVRISTQYSHAAQRSENSFLSDSSFNSEDEPCTVFTERHIYVGLKSFELRAHFYDPGWYDVVHRHNRISTNNIQKLRRTKSRLDLADWTHYTRSRKRKRAATESFSKYEDLRTIAEAQVCEEEALETLQKTAVDTAKEDPEWVDEDVKSAKKDLQTAERQMFEAKEKAAPAEEKVVRRKEEIDEARVKREQARKALEEAEEVAARAD